VLAHKLDRICRESLSASTADRSSCRTRLHNVRPASPASFPSPYKPDKHQRWVVPFRLVAAGENGLVPQRLKP